MFHNLGITGRGGDGHDTGQRWDWELLWLPKVAEARGFEIWGLFGWILWSTFLTIGFLMWVFPLLLLSQSFRCEFLGVWWVMGLLVETFGFKGYLCYSVLVLKLGCVYLRGGNGDFGHPKHQSVVEISHWAGESNLLTQIVLKCQRWNEAAWKKRVN